MAYIRDTYGVPAWRGQRVRYTGSGGLLEGVIVSAGHARIRVRVADRLSPLILHPTWCVEYLTK